nr:hypothetical protein [Tanacetum cinerariifolium]
EPESGKYQPLPEVPGKGKAKVSEEQATGTTDKPAKSKRIKRSASRKTHQPRSSPKSVDSEEESEKIVFGVEKGGQDEGQAGPDPNAQAEGQTGSDAGAQAEGQAGSNPDETSEGQAGSNPDETAEGQAGPDPDLEYLRYGSKGRRPALSISKMNAAYYPDAGLEQMVPDQFWIEEECKYDIATMYGHLNHLPPKDKKILTTAVNQWTRQLVIRQRVEDFQLGIESYQTQIGASVHVRNSEAFEDTKNLSQPGKLYWRMHQRGRLQTFEAYRLIKLLQHSRPLSDDL